MIELDDVRLRIGSRDLLTGVDARMREGELTCVLGPNGVGKTTLIRSIAGIRPIDGGRVTIDARDVSRLHARERARLVAYVAAEEAPLDTASVYDVVSIGRYSHHRWWQWRTTAADVTAVDAALDAVGAAHLRDREFGTLSSGERQRVWIALGLAQEAPVLLLDEPTSHLDVRVAHAILHLLRDLARGGKTIVCVLHDLNEAAAYADRLMLLGCGTLIESGTVREVLQPHHIERAYGIAMHAVETAHGPRVFPA